MSTNAPEGSDNNRHASVMDAGVITWKTHQLAQITPTTSVLVTAAATPIWPGYFEYLYGNSLSTSDQYVKLVYLFNLFQQVMYEKLKVTYYPRVTEWIGSDTSTAGDNPADGQAYITMLSDHEDPIIRTDNIDEYWQVRMQPQAKTIPATRTGTVDIVPHWSAESQSSNLTTANTVTTQTQPAEWMGTKGLQYPTTVNLNLWGPTNNLNLTVFYAFKYYIFTPWPDTAGSALSIGIFSYENHYKFRYPDYRVILGSPTLMKDEATLAQEAGLSGFSLSGKRKHLGHSHEVPQMTLKKEAFSLLNDKNADTPIMNEAIKRKQAIDDLVEVSSMGKPKLMRKI